jgi:hypothetical protein
MASRDLASVIQCCLSHGDARAGGDPALWSDALKYLASLEVWPSGGG